MKTSTFFAILGLSLLLTILTAVSAHALDEAEIRINGSSLAADEDGVGMSTWIIVPNFTRRWYMVSGMRIQNPNSGVTTEFLVGATDIGTDDDAELVFDIRLNHDPGIWPYYKIHFQWIDPLRTNALYLYAEYGKFFFPDLGLGFHSENAFALADGWNDCSLGSQITTRSGGVELSFMFQWEPEGSKKIIARATLSF